MRVAVEPAVSEKVCAIRDGVADLIGVNRFQTWFGGATEFELEGDQLDVRVANKFVGNWISANYMPQLVQAARLVVGGEPHVKILVQDSGVAPGSEAGASAPAAVPAQSGRPRMATRPDGRLVLRGELNSFVVGPSNQLAYSVASAIVNTPGDGFKHLVVHGGCGLGKTHLLQGVCNGVNRVHPSLEWRYLSGEEFTNEFVYAVKTGRVDQFRLRFRNIDLLVIDDIHFLANKKATQDEFLHTFNAIDASGKTVVLSSDRHPRSIATLSEPLVNRLIAAMIVEVKPPDAVIRREILRRRAATMVCELPPEVLDFLSQRITRNVRELEGALYKLAAYASLTKEALTLELARRVVEDYVGTVQPLDAEGIERIVAAYFGVGSEALRSHSRDRTATHARAVAMYLIRKHTPMSFPEIGRHLGNKQHSTVIMAVRRVQELIDQNGALEWRAAGGPHEVAVRTLLDELEQQLSHRAAS